MNNFFLLFIDCQCRRHSIAFSQFELIYIFIHNKISACVSYITLSIFIIDTILRIIIIIIIVAYYNEVGRRSCTFRVEAVEMSPMRTNIKAIHLHRIYII